MIRVVVTEANVRIDEPYNPDTLDDIVRRVLRLVANGGTSEVVGADLEKS